MNFLSVYQDLYFYPYLCFLVNNQLFTQIFIDIYKYIILIVHYIHTHC